MRVLIADDEPVARQVLREHLEDMPGVNIVGEAASGLAATELIEKLNPDVVLLDLQMPGIDGFGVARSLKDAVSPVVVFVTAFDSHALEAFNIGAADYLLKPVRRDRLATALARAKQRLQAPPQMKPPAEPLAKIVGRLGADYFMLDPAAVIAFFAGDEIVHILTASGKYQTDHTLKSLEDRLPADRFRRIHRKTIINVDHIRKISPLSSKRWLLKMSNGLEVVVSKRMAGVIRAETRW